MEEALIALLLGHVPVVGVFGKRVRLGRAPQKDAVPYAVLQVIDINRGYTFKGADGLVRSRVQIDIYAEKYSTAKEAARIVEALLSGHKDNFFRAIFLEDHRDLPAADAGNVNTLFRVSLDIIVYYGETQ